MRKIKIIIEDTESKTILSGETELGQVNELFEKHGINGLIEMSITINNELNKQTGGDAKFSFVSDLLNPPKDVKW